MSTTEATAETLTETTPRARLEIPIEPGVVFPNWSVVASDTVEQALGGIFQAFGVERAWRDMGADENRVRRAVMDEWGRTGHAPTPARVAEVTGLSADEVAANLAGLKRRDLLVLDESGEAIIGAYPLSELETGHRVALGDVVVNAMCAIDALGAGAMYGRDTEITSSCRHCGEPIRVQTRDAGATIEAFSPATAVVWSGIQLTDGCSADTMCTVMTFFCSDAHMDAWRKDNAEGIDGYRLSMDEGIQAGKAIFIPWLAAPEGDAPSQEGKAS